MDCPTDSARILVALTTPRLIPKGYNLPHDRVPGPSWAGRERSLRRPISAVLTVIQAGAGAPGTILGGVEELLASQPAGAT
ncbi:MAG: hypothetical protein J0H44_01955 [Alphaproteobacteria bacterium]|nr:hypothetical protein [Alphaproteobacteria bacterium]